MKRWMTAAACVLLGGAALAQALPMVDVHAHFQPPRRAFDAARRSALQLMDRAGVERTLLMPPPFDSAAPGQAVYDAEDILAAVRPEPGRFAVLGGSSLNVMLHERAPDSVDEALRSRFRARAQEILAQGAVGFGEIAALHLSLPAMGPRHPFEAVSPDHPLLLLLADIAAEKDVPIDLHCDLVPQDMALPDNLRANAANPARLQSNLEALQRLLAHNAKARIVWSHVGFEPLLTREPELVRSLLAAYPNLSMSFRLARGAPRPGAALNPMGRVKPVWAALVSQFPDRFMLGSDTFYADDGVARGSGEEGLANLRTLLDALPPTVARQVASGNAVRIYKLR